MGNTRELKCECVQASKGVRQASNQACILTISLKHWGEPLFEVTAVL